MLNAAEIDLSVHFIRQGMIQVRRRPSAPFLTLHWTEALIVTTSTKSEGPIFDGCTRAWSGTVDVAQSKGRWFGLVSRCVHRNA